MAAAEGGEYKLSLSKMKKRREEFGQSSFVQETFVVKIPRLTMFQMGTFRFS